MENTDSIYRKRTVLLIATLSSFLAPFMGSAINVALPAIGREFRMSAVALTWVATVYLLATALFLLPLGRWADIHGRKRVFLSGIVIFTCASLLLAFSPSSGWLLALRGFQGMGSAMVFCTAMPMLLSVYGASERGKVLGINVAAVYLGLSSGPVLSGVLIQHFGWRSIFFFTFGLGALTLALARRKLSDEHGDARGETFDLRGALFYSLCLPALVGAFSLLPSTTGFVLLLLGLAAAAAFVSCELRVARPLLDVRLFRHNLIFAYSNVAALINYAATFAVGFLLSLYLQHIKELTPQQTGLVLLAQPALMTVFSPFAGRLSDRIQPRIVASLGMGLITLGLLLLALLTPDSSLQYVLICLMLLGVGFAFFSSPNTNAVMSSVERPMYGVASAILSTARLSGHVLSMGLVTLILSLKVGGAQLQPEVYPQFLASLKLAFPIFAGLCLLGTFASLARGDVRRQNPALEAVTGSANNRDS